VSLFVKNRVLITDVIHVLVWVMTYNLVPYLNTRPDHLEPAQGLRRQTIMCDRCFSEISCSTEW